MALEAVEVFLRIALAGLAGILVYLTLAAYARVRNTKLMLIGLGFVGFFIKGLVLTIGIFDAATFAALPASVPGLLLDVGILTLLYAGTVKD